MSSDPSTFSVGLWLGRLLRHWRRLIAFGIAGAVLGYGFSLLRPPVYQAEAVLAIGIDYGRTKPLELIVEDRALDRVYQLLYSDSLLSAARERLQAEQGPNSRWDDVGELRRNLRLEQRLSDWHLIARNGRPELAAAMAGAWAQSAMNALDDASRHAWQAAALQGTVLDVECFSAAPLTSGEDTIQCLGSGTGLGPVQIEQLLEEIKASHGILPALSYEWARSPAVLSRPEIWDQGQLTFAGAILGVLARIVVLALGEGRRAKFSSTSAG